MSAPCPECGYEERIQFDEPTWRFYLGLGTFVGFVSGALMLGLLWWLT